MGKLLLILILGWAIIAEAAQPSEPPLLIDASQPAAQHQGLAVP